MNKKIITNKSDFISKCRAILKPGLYSILPQADRIKSVIPYFEKVQVQVLASPKLGANFIQYELYFDQEKMIKIQQNDILEHFLFVIEGEIEIETHSKREILKEGGFAYLPINTKYNIKKSKNNKGRVLITKKIYKPLVSLGEPSLIFSNIQNIPVINYGPHLGQHLTPFTDDLSFDMGMTIEYFEPGEYLSTVEIHVMEHGIYMLEGGLLYWLNGDYYEIQKNDYMYLAPYCPQFGYSIGGMKASYLLYKDVNRDYIENL